LIHDTAKSTTPSPEITLQENVAPKPETMTKIFFEKFYQKQAGGNWRSFIIYHYPISDFCSGDRSIPAGTAKPSE
jgi:hypothetical protein